MGAILSKLSLYLSAILAIPTLMILVSWNALPGETLYPVKRGFEEVPRVAFGKTKIAADYEVYLADRRFIEATTLVKTNNSLGLTELSSSIKTAETSVIASGNDQARDKLINNLLAYNQKLEEEKTDLKQKNPAGPFPAGAAPSLAPTALPEPAAKPSQPESAAPLPTPPASPATPSVPPTPTTTAAPGPGSSEDTTQVIEKTQDEIEKTIEKLKEKRKEKQKEKERENGKEKKENDRSKKQDD